MSYNSIESDHSSDLIDESKPEEQKHKFEKLGKSLSKMMKKEPDSKKKTGKDEESIIFGIPIQKAVEISRLKPKSFLPSIVEQSIEFLNRKGLEEEGIYRIPGSTSQVNNLKAMYNSGQKVNLDDHVNEIHTVAGLLKLYFRELPEPILTSSLHKRFQEAGLIQTDSERIEEINKLLDELPNENLFTLKAMMEHLLNVASHSDLNKMTTSNLGLVFSPCMDLPPQVLKIFLGDFEITLKRVCEMKTEKEKDKDKEKVETPPKRPVRTSSLPSPSSSPVSSGSQISLQSSVSQSTSNSASLSSSLGLSSPFSQLTQKNRNTKEEKLLASESNSSVEDPHDSQDAQDGLDFF